MALEKPYSIHKRGRIWYAQFKINNNWSSAKSTGQSAKSRAEAWCIDRLTEGQIIFHENITLKEYSKDFFDWNGQWATDKRVRGLRLSPRHCKERADLMRVHVLPALGDKKLIDIDRTAIKEFRNNLYEKGYAGNSINHALSTLKSILESAEEKSLIKYLPRIDRAANNPKQKGILTPEEVQRIFSIVKWWDIRGRVGNLLAATTGLRLGEIQALTLEDIHLEAGYIHVRRSYDKRERILNQTTKTGRIRNIFFPKRIQQEIKELIALNPQPNNPETFLFFSTKKPGKPMEQTIFLRSLYQAMKDIGISEDERRQRNITFHSWRHWLNSLLINAKIPLQKIQSITGHVTNEMSQHYYQLDDMNDVLKIQESIFTMPENGEEKLIN